MTRESEPKTSVRSIGLNDGSRDLERAIAEMAERLPEELAPLARLAFNYRWAWMVRGADVFQQISPSNWRRSAWSRIVMKCCR